MTERLHFHFSLSCIGEGNGNPLQCSWLENPRDGGAWWAAIYGVVQSRTWLKWLSRVPEELWTEVSDIVQETGIKTIPKKKKWKKAKWLSKETLQIAVKRREVKSKWEKERYTHLNAEVQGIARRNNKGFLSDQWKEIEENNRMGKTRDLFKKIRTIKGTFQAKMGTIKNRNDGS